MKYQVLTDIIGGNSKKYSQEELDHVGDLLLALPHDVAFVMLKEMVRCHDINERLVLRRDDVFSILKKKPSYENYAVAFGVQ